MRSITNDENGNSHGQRNDSVQHVHYIKIVTICLRVFFKCTNHMHQIRIVISAKTSAHKTVRRVAQSRTNVVPQNKEIHKLQRLNNHNLCYNYLSISILYRPRGLATP